MKNRNGFTLVEVLAVIVVLGFISTIFIPNALKILKSNNLKIYKIKEQELEKSASDYVLYENSFVPPTAGEEKYITMSQLVAGSYMNKILDSSSGNECKAFVKVTLNDIYGYNYEACLICEEYKTNKDFCNIDIYKDL